MCAGEWVKDWLIVLFAMANRVSVCTFTVRYAFLTKKRLFVIQTVLIMRYWLRLKEKLSIKQLIQNKENLCQHCDKWEWRARFWKGHERNDDRSRRIEWHEHVANLVEIVAGPIVVQEVWCQMLWECSWLAVGELQQNEPGRLTGCYASLELHFSING